MDLIWTSNGLDLDFKWTKDVLKSNSTRFEGESVASANSEIGSPMCDGFTGMPGKTQLDRKGRIKAFDLMNTPKSVLICDANHPLISSCLKDELLLYHIDRHSETALLERFESLSGKRIEASFELNELSGGQKVLLMLCLALLSPATAICFKGLRHCLDEARWEHVQSSIHQAGKEIIWDTDQC